MVMSVTLNRLRRRQSLQPTDVSVNRHTHKSDELLPSLSRAAHAQTASAPVQSVRRISPSNRRRSAAASLCRRVRPSVRPSVVICPFLSLALSPGMDGSTSPPVAGRAAGRPVGRPALFCRPRLPRHGPSSVCCADKERPVARAAPRRAARCGAARRGPSVCQRALYLHFHAAAEQ